MLEVEINLSTSEAAQDPAVFSSWLIAQKIMPCNNLVITYKLIKSGLQQLIKPLY